MAIRIYHDILILANTLSQSGGVQIPPGIWRVTALMALASTASPAGNEVTQDVETIIALNEVDRFKATERGVPEPIISGGVPLMVTATRKGAKGDVFVRVILTLEQY